MNTKPSPQAAFTRVELLLVLAMALLTSFAILQSKSISLSHANNLEQAHKSQLALFKAVSALQKELQMIDTLGKDKHGQALTQLTGPKEAPHSIMSFKMPNSCVVEGPRDAVEMSYRGEFRIFVDEKHQLICRQDNSTKVLGQAIESLEFRIREDGSVEVNIVSTASKLAIKSPLLTEEALSHRLIVYPLNNTR